MPQLFWLKIAGARPASLFQTQLSCSRPPALPRSVSVSEHTILSAMASSRGAADEEFKPTSGDKFKVNKENRPYAFIRRSVERRIGGPDDPKPPDHRDLPAPINDPPQEQSIFPLMSFIFRLEGKWRIWAERDISPPQFPFGIEDFDRYYADGDVRGCVNAVFRYFERIKLVIEDPWLIRAYELGNFTENYVYLRHRGQRAVGTVVPPGAQVNSTRYPNFKWEHPTIRRVRGRFIELFP